MFRLQDNVPQNYVSQSRDFQLFCRLYDYIGNGVKFDIDSMLSILDPMKVKNNMLKLLAIRVGFFPTRELDDTLMRYIISTFPVVTKLKGTKKGICACIDTVLRARNINATYSVSINNEDYTIDIAIKSEFDRIALEEYLRYIIPPGYITTMSIAQAFEVTTQIDQISVVHTYIDTNTSVSSVTDDYNNLPMPTYSIKITPSDVNHKPLYFTSSGSPEINIEEDASGSKTTFIYYERAENSNLYYQKTLKMFLPKKTDIQSRKFGDIVRAEVIGSDNDGAYVSQITHSVNGGVVSYQSSFVTDNGERVLYKDADNNVVDSTTGRLVSDIVGKQVRYNNEIVAKHLTSIFTDLLEQENNHTLVFRLKSKKLYTFPKETIGDNDQVIPISGSVLREPMNIWQGVDDESYPTDFSDSSVDDDTNERCLYGSITTGGVDIPEGLDEDALDTSNDTYKRYLIDDYGTVAEIITSVSINNLNLGNNSVFCFKLYESNLGTPPVIAEKSDEDIVNDNGGNNG